MLADDDLYLGASPEEFETERRHNMWCLGATSAQLRQTGAAALAGWIGRLVGDRRAKARRKYPGRRAVLYLWFDEQAGQLRLNVVADHGRPLPFGHPVWIVESPDPILCAFVESPYVDGIPFAEVRQAPCAGDPTEHDAGASSPADALDVFVTAL